MDTKKIKTIKSYRPKKFLSMESLWSEIERIATFIDWPVSHISPKALAADGFYYLRTKDHCACAFCRGIIGSWERGDTPRGEHIRHFPHCPFVLGKVTANIPLAIGKILEKLPKELCQQDLSTQEGEDVCGTGTTKIKDDCSSEANSKMSLHCLGMKEYCGPKRKDFLTPESRLKSFKKWPETVTQTPEDLSEAGFFYCGLSDHVRCFHCNKGLRNWEKTDDPWVEHARWYPDCNFILLKKGREFVEKVQNENPPFIPGVVNYPKQESSGSCFSTPSLCCCIFTEEDIDVLMKLHINQEVIAMGFSPKSVRVALKRCLKVTGFPFSSLETAVESVFAIMDEEKKRTSTGCEYFTTQAQKKAHSLTFPNLEAIVSTCTCSTNNQEEYHSIDCNFYTTPTSSSIGIDDRAQSNSTRTNNETSRVISREFPQARSLPMTTQTSQTSENSSTVVQIGDLLTNGSGQPYNDYQTNVVNSLASVARVSSGSSDSEESTSSENELPASSGSSIASFQATSIDNTLIPMADDTASTSPMSVGSHSKRNGQDCMIEADEVIEKAAKHLSLPATEGSSSSSSSHTSEGSEDSGFDKEMETEEVPLHVDESTNCQNASSNKAESLAKELETLKETRTCRVCMDKEMDIVFLPCTHMVACSSCAVALATCPICRKDIQYAFKPIIT